MVKNLLLLPTVAIALIACGGGKSAARLATIDTLPGGIVRTISHAPADSGQWQLVLERTLQPDEGAPGELNDFGDLVLADDGTLFVVDEKPETIKRFDPQGNFVRSFGREGDGPGEFRTGFVALSGDTLVLQDPRATRATMFSANDGSVLLTTPTVCCYWSRISMDGAGRAVAWSIAQPDTLHPAQAFVRFSLDGKTLDTVRVTNRGEKEQKRWRIDYPGTSMSVPVLLAANNINAIDPTGGFITGWSADYLLRVTKNGGDTVALFGRTGEPKRVSAEDKARMITQLIQDRLAPMKVPEEKLREILHPDDIPDHHPAFDWIAVDRSGRRWIRMSTGDTMTVRFDLFSKEGRWLDQVALANSEWARSAYQAASWSKDHVAVKGESADGRALVRIYRIVRKGAP